MRFGSVCSGIEAASVAWNPLGWKAAWFSEIEPFPCAVLAHHYPDVPNLGDMRTLAARIRSGEVEAPDILCGGTPCTSFSFAGKRQSLDDERGNLSLVFCEVADAVDAARTVRGERPSLVFWENVPGVLCTKDNAFGCFLGRLVGADVPLSTDTGRWPCAGVVAGPKRKAAWRILDAQFFGVPQRRRRVYVVASSLHRGGVFDPAQILFERKGLSGNPAKSGEPRQNTPAYVESSFGAFREDTLAGTSKASGGVLGGGSETLIVDRCYDMSHACDVIRETPIAPTLNARMGTGGNQIPLVLSECGTWSAVGEGIAPPLKTTTVSNVCVSEARVRKLTPVECERLQGFPDNYTQIPYRGKPAEDCPDSPRYKALGNSWAVPVVRWIGRRINKQLEKK